jgi:thymidylate synthase (FAD)
MRNTEINIYPIASTRINPDEVEQWLASLGAEGFCLDGTSEANAVIGLAAKRCYMSFKVGLNPNITRVRLEWAEYFDNVLKSRHGSVLEHATYSFAIENVSRVLTAELNRHRAGVAISEGSMRYIRFDDIPYWIPFSIRDAEGDDQRVLAKKAQSRSIFKQAFFDAEQHYKRLTETWEEELAPASTFQGKKQITSMMRRIIPMGVSTGGVWTFNLRALRHILELRTEPAAEEEINYVLNLIGNYIIQMEPNIFQDFEHTANGELLEIWKPYCRKV